MTTPTPRTLQESTASLGTGRCLRLRPIRGTEGEPAGLWISGGWHAGGDARHRNLGPLPGRALVETMDDRLGLESQEVQG